MKIIPTLILSRLTLVLILALSLFSCSATRITTTEHTAVEQALLTYSTRKAFSKIDFSELVNQRVFIESVQLPSYTPSFVTGEEENWHQISPNYLKLVFEKNLLEQGLFVLDKKEDADISLKLVFDIASIDDSDFVLGLPSVPVPVAAAGTSVQTPELSLFSSATQTGKVRFSIYGKENQTGRLVFLKKSEPTEKFYSRWSMLLIFGWRVTDLGRPF